MTRPDGRQVFDGAHLPDRPRELLQAALAEANSAPLQTVMTQPGRSKTPRKPASPLPLAACHSENAGFALLRRGWSSDSEMLAVQYGGDTLTFELSAGRDVVCSGIWSIELEADGKPLTQRSNWDHVCWVSDKDVDYLELEARFVGGVRVQRQMLLARQDRLLYLADVVLGQADCRLQYRGVLPLLPKIDVVTADECEKLPWLVSAAASCSLWRCRSGGAICAAALWREASLGSNWFSSAQDAGCMLRC